MSDAELTSRLITYLSNALPRKLTESLHAPAPGARLRPGDPVNVSCVLDPGTTAAPACNCPMYAAANTAGDCPSGFSSFPRTAVPEIVCLTTMRTLLPVRTGVVKRAPCDTVHAENHCWPPRATASAAARNNSRGAASRTGTFNQWRKT